MRISDWSSDVCSSDLQTRGEPRPVPDARRFAIAIALREDDVVDACRIDLRALDQRLQDDGAEFAGAHRRQAAAELADGGADRGDDGGAAQGHFGSPVRSEEHTSELQSLMRISYAVFCLKKKKYNKHQ